MNTAQTKTTPSDLIITPFAADVAGCVSYWRAGGSISLEALLAAWTAAGLDPKLVRSAPDDGTALRRAVQEQQSKHRLVRALKRGEWAVVDEHVVQVPEGQPAQPPTYTTFAIVRYKGEGNLSRPAVQGIDGNPHAVQEFADDITSAFMRQQGLLDSSDVTSWLVKLAYKHNAVTLRDSGGVYFIPRPAMDFWNKAAAVVEKVSRGNHLVFRIPAMKNDEAVAAITDAITQEAAAVVAKMQEELAVVGDDALGKRAIAGRQAEAEALLAKLSSYEELLGKQLAVRENVGQLQANLTVAALKFDTEEQA